MDPQRKVRSLFELKEAEFVGSVTGITNGKEGLRQMLEDLRMEDDHEGVEGQVTAVTSSPPPSAGGDVVLPETGEVERGLTCRTCEVTFTRSVILFILFPFSHIFSLLWVVWRSRGITSSLIGTGAM
jgi:hypothetical protein